MKNIQDKHIFAVLGGDARQRTVAKRLIESGAKVRTYALGDSGDLAGASVCNSVERAIAGSNVIILPLPVSRDNINLSVRDLNLPGIELCDIVKLAKKYGVVYILGGMVPEEMQTVCQKLDIKIFDYYKSESLQEKNALPSAEGALMVAMENTDITVMGMKALVCGYGRIGKKLAYILKRLGASVTVAARRDETVCEATMGGYDTLKIGSDSWTRGNFDVIFNTVPSVIFTETAVSELKGDTLYIEIASNPGGIDISAARKRSIRVINAPSLPGKYSPRSAGDYIFETVREILAEGGTNI